MELEPVLSSAPCRWGEGQEPGKEGWKDQHTFLQIPPAGPGSGVDGRGHRGQDGLSAEGWKDQHTFLYTSQAALYSRGMVPGQEQRVGVHGGQESMSAVRKENLVGVRTGKMRHCLLGDG